MMRAAAGIIKWYGIVNGRRSYKKKQASRSDLIFGPALSLCLVQK
jgi:hypothetical protein